MPVTRSMTGASRQRQGLVGDQQPTNNPDPLPPQQDLQYQQPGQSAEQLPEQRAEQRQRPPLEETFMVNREPSAKMSLRSKKSEIEDLEIELATIKEEALKAKMEKITAILRKKKSEYDEEEEKSHISSASQCARRTQQWVDQHSNIAWDLDEDFKEEYLEKERAKAALQKTGQMDFEINRKIKVEEDAKQQTKKEQEINEKRNRLKREDFDDFLNEYNQTHEAKKPEVKVEQKIDLTDLVSAFTLAARSVQPTPAPRYIGELPHFNGAYQDWLAFRAAYQETAPSFSEVDNTARLRRALKGRALEAVRCLLIANAKPGEILETLETRFGRPDSIALSELDSLKNIQRTTESPQDVCLFATKVQNAVATLEALKRRHYLYSPEVVKILTQKLTPSLRAKWLDIIEDRTEDEPDLLTFSKFIVKEARKMGRFASPERIKEEKDFTHRRSTEPRREFYRGQFYRKEDPYRINRREEPRRTYGREETHRRDTRRDDRYGPNQDRIYRASNKEKERNPAPSCDICKKEHEAKACRKFLEVDSDSRWELAKQHNLCFRCLKKRTFLHKCEPQSCGVDSCNRTHHALLHYTVKNKEQSKPKQEERVTSASANKNFSFLKVLPVTVKGPKGEMDIYALLDDGSTVTLIDSKVAEQIGCEGPIDPLQIEAVAGAKLETDESKHVTLRIKGMKCEFPMKARTIEKLQLSPQSVSSEDIDHCSHLHDIKHDVQYKEGKPRLLIGQDNWQFLIADSVRRGPSDQPVASLTPLGWVLHGVNTRSLGRQVNYCYTLTKEDDIDEQVKKYFAMDSLGISPKNPSTDPEEKALTILRQKTKEREEGGYETGLLWKTEDINLPNNYDQALKRLYGTEKKIDKDQKLKIGYEKQIDDLIKKGYAELAESPPIPGKTWYLPHFAVLQPSKPGKVRVVFDAAAKSGGTSLNDKLLSGPDLLQSLPGVLMRFRQHPIAVAADIEEMFLRIGIAKEDRDALRFLWRHDRREGPPTEYRMKSVIFGAASSPCTALYIKNFNAEKHKERYPEARDAIIFHHYMDDYLQSFKTEEEAIKVATEVKLVHKNGNFNLRKWSSNNENVLNALRSISEEATDEVKLDSKEEKVLGLIWKPKNDTLSFNLNFSRIPEEIVQSTRTPTKREALKTIMSLYDPLGLVSPVTIQAKQILQETWRQGTEWDKELPKEAAIKWKTWIGHLQNLRNIEIPRYHPEFSACKEKELHTFVDASESAYAAAVYWRKIDEQGNVHVSLAAAKARVAPLKLTSIPRLELQAAVIGSRLAKTVTEEYQIKPSKRYFWTDSKTVLQWLRTGPRAFKSFVAHRIAEIEEETSVNDWRWVPTSHNVADDATRDVPPNFTKEHRWFTGPDFLKNDPETWPKEKETETRKTGEERVHVIQTEKTKLTESLPNIARFSSWLRLIRTTARVLQFIDLVKPSAEKVNYKRTQKRKEKDPNWSPQITKPRTTNRQTTSTAQTTDIRSLEGRYIRKAEELWIIASQEESFPEEIHALKHNKEIPRESRLQQFAIIVENSILKLKSRIAATKDVSTEQKQPAILDGDNSYTRLYLQWLHQKLLHAGTEMLVNEARQHHWILKLRPTAKNIVKSCLKCRMRKAIPPEPPTGDHPYTRLAHHQRPFTYTGLDYFGPVSVTVGRSHQKRYVALFTCLTTRAVHLEIAANLSTDSAISALRRFMARRGCPAEIHSDNGTNLHGADRELTKALQDEAANHKITWKFIPPGAPFMGGAWERLVRSVKTALYSVLEERHPQEETLATLLCEAEYTVNSRPLTHVSTSTEDEEALTPNHFLLGGSGIVTQCGNFTDIDLKLRHQWRHAQRLADIFWQRWIKEYLPELQHRREPKGQGKPLQQNDLVLIVDPNLPRNTWPRGKIIKLYPGQDGIIRAVDVQTAGGILRRPTKRLVVLPTSEEVVAPRN